MAAADDPSVAGGWLGTYYYRNGYQPPVRFEATFTAKSAEGGGGGFSGTILDDGPLGEAIVSRAVQVGRHVRFTKSYLNRAAGAGRVIAPIQYLGTLSEDGLLVSGTWEIGVRRGGGGEGARVHGRWEARRLWGESVAFENMPLREPQFSSGPAASP